MRQHQQQTSAFTKHNALDLDIHKEFQIQADAKEMSTSVSQVNQTQLMSIYIDFWLHTGTLASTQNLRRVSKSKPKRKYFINIRNHFLKSLRSLLSLRQVWLAQTFCTSVTLKGHCIDNSKRQISSFFFLVLMCLPWRWLLPLYMTFIPYSKLRAVKCSPYKDSAPRNKLSPFPQSAHAVGRGHQENHRLHYITVFLLC